jgi:hypothetical protein
MARYRLVQSIYSNVTGQWQKLPTGTTFADTTANAVAGDIVSASLTTSPNPNIYVPLDSAAVAQYTARGITTAVGNYVGCVGVDSVA